MLLKSRGEIRGEMITCKSCLETDKTTMNFLDREKHHKMYDDMYNYVKKLSKK